MNNKKYDEPDAGVDVLIEKLMVNIESEFTGLETDITDREKEKEMLTNKISELTIKLSQIKNPVSLAKMPFNKRDAISKKLNKDREIIRKNIKRCKCRLDEIKIEETPNPAESNSKTDEEVKNKWHQNPYDF
jgi:chromosome segregation ATPase